MSKEIKTAENAAGTAATGGDLPKLSAARARVLDLLKKGFSVSDIVKITGKKERGVRDIRSKLVKMGLWNTAATPLPKTVPVNDDGSIGYRIHDFILTFPVHMSSEKYLRATKQGNRRRHDGHYVQLYTKSVVIRGARGFSFKGVNHEDAKAQADEYFMRLVKKLENWYNVLLTKHDMVFEMSYETAETNNDLAEHCAKRKDWVKVVDDETGESWAVIDHSDTYEVDTTSKVDAGDDMQRVIAPVFNDYRHNVNGLRKPSETWAMHDDLTEKQLRFVSEVRRLEAVTARLVEMQSSFYDTQSMLTRAQTKLLQAQMPKKERASKASDSDLSELRRYTG